MEETISLKDVFLIIRKRWKLIIISMLVTGSISGGISYYVLKPVYQASTQMLVNQKNSDNQIDVTQLRSNVDLINTYSVIIKSPIILEKVKENLNLQQSIDELNHSISINSQDNSQVFSLTVESQNAEQAVDIANSISDTFQQEISQIMNVDNVSILARAEYEETPIPIKPNPYLNIAVALVVGGMIGVGWAFLKESMDKTIKNTQDIEAILALPVLGTIQNFKNSKMPKELSVKQRRSETLES
ncbi:YveK family protein [Bacillus massiliigorillae]|uniref:YveK family protein n=1 Tax=Bacillus massiliigorillae TaxID=1243664 RepID=UPI0003A4523E|nr:Wzz/FepE/Etk N-terminal domain-containing protein [Bacillus massiliigorillae]